MIRQILPRSLLGRSLIIIVGPLILLQAVSAFTFYDRHWTTISRRLSEGIAGDVGADAAHVVHRQELGVHARHDFETPVVEAGIVDRDHARHVVRHEWVRGRVLMGCVARPAGELVVDLLLEEHSRLTEEGGRRLDQRASRQE